MALAVAGASAASTPHIIAPARAPAVGTVTSPSSGGSPKHNRTVKWWWLVAPFVVIFAIGRFGRAIGGGGFGAGYRRSENVPPERLDGDAPEDDADAR